MLVALNPLTWLSHWSYAHAVDEVLTARGDTALT